MSTALLTFSIGPVHGFIAQARRVADLWAGSDLLSHLISTAVTRLLDWPGAQMVFPSLERGDAIPSGLPNRFVCRVPLAEADAAARALKDAVEGAWDELVEHAVKRLAKRDITPDVRIGRGDGTAGSRQTDKLLEIAWSWIPEDRDYAAAASAGARRFAASRLFRPFAVTDEGGEKCAICGERTALPNGQWDAVRARWEAAAASSEGTEDEPYFRFDQGRLCLVCATKRFYPSRRQGGAAYFSAFEDFQPSERQPYFAVVKLDGDRMGEILGWGTTEIAGGDVEGFHREVSKRLTAFAESLRTPASPRLNLDAVGRAPRKDRKWPQLVYAGGEDVLLVCDPRDALPLAWRIRELYRRTFEDIGGRLVDPGRAAELTISAAILFAHTKHPAGLLFRDVETLLKTKAKKQAGRNAVALRLVKRGGVPVEAAFKWDDVAVQTAGGPLTWVQAFDKIVDALTGEALSSTQSFNLRRREDEALFGLLTEEQWTAWLRDRLSRREAPGLDPGVLALFLTPFFHQQKTPALRIARFLTREMGTRTGEPQEATA